MHSQMAVSNLSWQCAFIPHGEGLHGVEDIGGTGVAKIIIKNIINFKIVAMF